jgi:RND superfamily putative drug exporter
VSGVLYGLAGFCVRHRYRVLVAWLVLVVAFVVISNGVGKQTSNNLTLPGTGSTQAQDLLQDNLPKQANGTNPVVMETSSGTLTTGKNEQAVKATVSSLKKAPHVIGAVSPLSSEGASALSKDERIGYISVTIDVSSSDLTEDQANEIIDAESPARDAGF